MRVQVVLHSCEVQLRQLSRSLFGVRRAMSDFGEIVLQNDFERRSEEHFSETARQCGILI